MEDFSYNAVKDKWTDELKSHTTSRNQSNVDTIIYPPGCAVNSKFIKCFPRIRNFEVFPDDTWVASFPKCGTDLYFLNKAKCRPFFPTLV